MKRVPRRGVSFALIISGKILDFIGGCGKWLSTWFSVTYTCVYSFLYVCWRQAQRRPPPSSVDTWVRSASTLIKGPALSREHTETARVYKERERESERARKREKVRERERKALFSRQRGKVSVVSAQTLHLVFSLVLLYIFFPPFSSFLQSRRLQWSGRFIRIYSYIKIQRWWLFYYPWRNTSFW